MPRGRSLTSAEHTALLEADPDWVAQRDARDRDLALTRCRLHEEQAPLLAELQAVGIDLSTVWHLSSRTPSYQHAIPILLAHLQRSYDQRILEGIAYALAYRAARPLGWELMIDLARGRLREKPALSAMMAAISAMALPSDLEAVMELISDRSLGSGRIFLVRNMMRSRNPRAREMLLSLRDDPDLRLEIAARLKISSTL